MVNATKPLVYLSFDIAHDEPAHLQFIQESARCPVQFAVDGTTSGEQPVNGRASLVQERVRRASIVIVLIGESTHKSKEVGEELTLARTANVPFFGVQISQNEPANERPSGLAENRTIPWDWERIGSAISQLMREGKHHVFK